MKIINNIQKLLNPVDLNQSEKYKYTIEKVQFYQGVLESHFSISFPLSITCLIIGFYQDTQIIEYITLSLLILAIPYIVKQTGEKLQFDQNKYLNFIFLINIGYSIIISIIKITILYNNFDSSNDKNNDYFILGFCMFAFHSTLFTIQLEKNIIASIIICLFYSITVFQKIELGVGCILVMVFIYIPYQVKGEQYQQQIYRKKEKYYFYYYLVKNIIPTKVIITKVQQDSKFIQLHFANTQAIKKFNIFNDQGLEQFLKQIQLNPVILEQFNDEFTNINNSFLRQSPGRLNSQNTISSQTQLKNYQAYNPNIIEEEQQQPLELILKQQIQNQIVDQIIKNKEQQEYYQQSEQQQQIQNSNININNNNNNNQQLQQQETSKLKSQQLIEKYQQNNQNLGNKSQLSSKIQQLTHNGQTMKTPSLPVQQQNMCASLIPFQRKNLFETYKGNFNKEITKQSEFFLKLGGFSYQDNYQVITIDDDEKVLRDIGLQLQYDCKSFIYQVYSLRLMQQMDILLENLVQQQQFIFLSQNEGFQNTNQLMQYFQQSYNTAHILMNMIQYNSFYSYMVDSQLEQDHTHFSLEEMIQDLITLIQPQAQAQGVELIFKNELPQELIEICNDQSIVMNIMLYILMNCLQYTRKGYIIIQLFNSNEVDEVQGSIKVHIRDTSTRKWPKKTYPLNNKKLLKQSFDDIQISITQQLLSLVGPYDKLFLHSEQRQKSNKASFYLYTDLKWKDNLLGELNTDFKNNIGGGMNNGNGTHTHKSYKSEHNNQQRYRQQTLRTVLTQKTQRSQTNRSHQRYESHRKSCTSIKTVNRNHSELSKTNQFEFENSIPSEVSENQLEKVIKSQMTYGNNNIVNLKMRKSKSYSNFNPSLQSLQQQQQFHSPNQNQISSNPNSGTKQEISISQFSPYNVTNQQQQSQSQSYQQHSSNNNKLII